MQEDATRSTPSILTGWRYRALVVTIVLSALGYLLFSIGGGWHDVMQGMREVGAWGVTLCLLLSLVNYGLRFVRWNHYLVALGHRVPILCNLRIYIAGFALTTTPGKAGESLRSVFLKRHGVCYRRSLGALVAERLSDVISVAALATWGLGSYPPARPFMIGLACLIACVLLALQSTALLRRIEDGAMACLPKKLGKSVRFMIELILSIRTCFRLQSLLYGIALGIVAWGAEAVAFYYLLGYLGCAISLPIATFIYCFAMLVGGLTFLPGGLGGSEVALLKLLTLNGASTSVAVVATIVIRITTLWFSVILGLCMLPRRAD